MQLIGKCVSHAANDSVIVEPEPAISASESPTSRICAESATGAVSLKCHDARPRPRLPSVETGKPSSEQLGDVCKCESDNL